MSKTIHIKVREMSDRDIKSFIDYWFTSGDEFLIEMGVDLEKLPPRDVMIKNIQNHINTSLKEKSAYYLIWEINGTSVGHTNVNKIQYGLHGFMHLHLWNPNNRKRGIGTEFVRRSLPFYFENLQLQTLYCEPYAQNAAPNNTLKKVGFEFIKKYRTVPSSITFDQEVNRWQMSEEQFKQIKFKSSSYE